MNHEEIAKSIAAKRGKAAPAPEVSAQPAGLTEAARLAIEAKKKKRVFT